VHLLVWIINYANIVPHVPKDHKDRYMHLGVGEIQCSVINVLYRFVWQKL